MDNQSLDKIKLENERLTLEIKQKELELKERELSVLEKQEKRIEKKEKRADDIKNCISRVANDSRIRKFILNLIKLGGTISLSSFFANIAGASYYHLISTHNYEIPVIIIFLITLPLSFEITNVILKYIYNFLRNNS